ncbi:MAG: isochorismatase family protein [Bacteriovoracaceae bacterium]
MSSEQLELLLAFEKSNGLSELSKVMGRDLSVISRQLQKLAEEYPVLTKEKGKWMMSPLGFQINEITTRNILEYQKAFNIKSARTYSAKDSVLVVINAQIGLLNAKSDRSNLKAEDNIKKLILHWRHSQANVIHIQHWSENPDSLFYKDSPTSNFLAELAPHKNELVIKKSKSSSFTETNLQESLDQNNLCNLILVGFTANECIEATAKDAFEKGYNVVVAGDATAMFDFVGHDNRVYKAEKIHDLVLANINALYAKVENTDLILSNKLSI